MERAPAMFSFERCTFNNILRKSPENNVMRSWFVKQLAALILQLPAIKLQQDDIINKEIV